MHKCPFSCETTWQDISDCVGVPGTQKIPCVKVSSHYVIEKKEHHHSINACSQYTLKSLGKDTPDSSAVHHLYQNIANIESVSQDQWLLTDYKTGILSWDYFFSIGI